MYEQTSKDIAGSVTRRSWIKLVAVAIGGISSGATTAGAKSTVDPGYGAGGYGEKEYGASVASSTSSLTVRVTGNDVAAYNDGDLIRYMLETDGTIEPGEADDLEDYDRAGGPTASGSVAANNDVADTYELVDGTLSNVTTWGGEVTVTVDGVEWSE